MREETGVSAAERKRLASHAAYVKSKQEREHALFRLRSVSLARLDAARAALGLSRSAYIEALLDAASPIAQASDSNSNCPPCSIGDEFEALFGAGA